jgi:hypothetical protein
MPAEQSGPERVWHERLCRELSVSSVAGVALDQEGRDAAHKLLRALSSPFEYADQVEHERECERLGQELKAAKVRVEDAAAERLGLPPRPTSAPPARASSASSRLIERDGG